MLLVEVRYASVFLHVPYRFVVLHDKLVGVRHDVVALHVSLGLQMCL